MDRNRMEALFMELGFRVSDDALLAQGYFFCCLVHGMGGNANRIAVIQDRSVAQKLAELKITYYDALISNTTTGQLNLIEELCGLLEQHGLFYYRRFFQEFSPFIVADWDRFEGQFDLSQGKTGPLLLMLTHLLSHGRDISLTTDGSPDDSQLDAYFQNVPMRKGSNLKECWEAVFLWPLKDIPIRVGGNVKQVLKLYAKYGAPYSMLLTHYTGVISSGKETAKKAWEDFVKRLSESNVELGEPEDEILFRNGAYMLRKVHPTVLIQAAFYSKDRNDSGLECSFLLKELTDRVEPEHNVLIVNPSPAVLLKWEKIHEKKNFYAVTDQWVKTCYELEFPRAGFVVFSSIHELKDIDLVLVMARDIDREKVASWFPQLLDVMRDSAQMIALLPNAIFDKAAYGLREKLEQRYHIHRILYLPPKAAQAGSLKKVIVYMEKVLAAQEHPVELYDSEIYTPESGPKILRI